ncbi:hypothetical protein UlMin_025393 [Ulmus minor]
MSFVSKFPKKSLHSQPLFAIATRFLTLFPEKPTSAHYDELVNDAGRSGDFETLRQLLTQRVKDGFYNTNNTFRFITNDNASLSSIDALAETLARIDKGPARKSAYDALVSRLCKLGRVEESLRVVDAMARGNHGLSASTFHPVIDALTRKNRVEDAWRVVDGMRSLGVSPDVRIYNDFLMRHCFAAELGPAAGVLTRMEEQGMKADPRTYDALVLGACRAGKVEGALVVLRRMEDDGVAMGLSTRLYVIDGLLSLGYYDQAVKFARIYIGKDAWLDSETFGCLATRFIKLRKMDMAKLVLEEMKTRGIGVRAKLKDVMQNLGIESQA